MCIWRQRYLERPAAGYPRWRDVKLESADVGVRHEKYKYQGFCYVTKGELLTAQLLVKQQVDFTPDVTFTLRQPKSRKRGSKGYKTVIYRPDFIFNRDTYLWTMPDGKEIPIHGIECKAKSGLPQKVQLLFERRNIRVIVLNDREIHMYAKAGNFPLRLLRRYRFR